MSPQRSTSFRAHPVKKLTVVSWVHDQTLLYKTLLYKISPCTRLCQKVSPCLWVKELCPEHWSKVLILKVWWIVFLHEFHKLGYTMLPAGPKPFCSKSGYWVHPPVHKNTKLSLIIPRGEWSWVQWFPCWFILTQHQGNKSKGEEKLCTIHFQLAKP